MPAMHSDMHLFFPLPTLLSLDIPDVPTITTQRLQEKLNMVGIVSGITIILIQNPNHQMQEKHYSHLSSILKRFSLSLKKNVARKSNNRDFRIRSNVHPVTYGVTSLNGNAAITQNNKSSWW